MTVTDVRGVGSEEPYRGVKFVMTFVPKVRVELAIEAGDVNQVEQLVTPAHMVVNWSSKSAIWGTALSTRKNYSVSGQ